MALDLFAIRSLLFLPASNPRAIKKARTAGADLVILDLEDSVKPEDKAEARRAAVEAVSTSWPVPVAIRVNGFASEWNAQDVAAVLGSSADAIVVPNVRALGDFEEIRTKAERPIIAMIESAAGILAAPAIARAASALMVGTNDLANDLRLPRNANRGSLMLALQSVVLAARAAGVAVFDGVFNTLDDDEGLATECRDGRAFGFDGKSLIHPKQIATCHRAFAPTDAELARAERLIAAATGGAERFEGEMIERMHIEAAKRLIAQSPR